MTSDDLESLKERLAKEANNADTLSESYEGQRQEGWFKAFAATFREALARIEELEAESQENWQKYVDANEALIDAQAVIATLQGKLDRVIEALDFGGTLDAYYNLEGALYDLRRDRADPICIKTLERVQEQISSIGSILSDLTDGGKE